MPAAISFDPSVLDRFCRKHRIRRLSLFGSARTGQFRPGSDVDLLVEFEPGAPVGYLELAGMELELSDLLGHKVDLRTPQELSPYFRDRVMATAETLYAR